MQMTMSRLPHVSDAVLGIEHRKGEQAFSLEFGGTGICINLKGV